MAKKRKGNIFKTKATEPKWDDAKDLTGEQYSRRMHAAQEHYRMDFKTCLLYTSPSPRDRQKSRMASCA